MHTETGTGRLVDAAFPEGWAPLPTKTIASLRRMEDAMRELYGEEQTSYVWPDGTRYVVPGEDGQAALVEIEDGGPGAWYCACPATHEDDEELCLAVIQVALLRGTFLRKVK